jgi:Tol biopolymer transport system component
MLECSPSLAGNTAGFSPSGEYFASLAGSRVVAKSRASGSTNQIFQCLDKVDKFMFSPDSTMLMCALYTRNVVQVFSMEDKEWKCRINEGVAGLINAFWTPDSSNIVTESDFGIQMSIWSLTSGTSTIVSLPKPPSSPYSKTSAFSDCGRFVAVVHRIEHHDQIGVCSVLPPMGEVSKFKAKSNEVASIQWVPDGTHLVTLDAPLVYRICVYTPMGKVRYSTLYSVLCTQFVLCMLYAVYAVCCVLYAV